MKINRVCILGGTGFVGQHLTARLAARGIKCRILSRHPHRHRDMKVLPGVRLYRSNIFDPEALAVHFADCEAVINLVGILNEGRSGGFHRAHVELVGKTVDAAKAARVPQLLHMSALHASRERGPSQYLVTKGEGEELAHTRGQPLIRVTSFRPSVIFGPGDSFFNRFAQLLRLAPGPFPLACAEARFAPVYVGDVVAAFIHALEHPADSGRHFDLCGPQAFTLRELVRYTARQLGLDPPIIGLNNTISRLQAHLFGLLPGKPFSYDNYLSLQVASVCEQNGLNELGIRPRAIDEIVPLYLSGQVKRQRYNQLQRVG
jgi:NADH dehydrogenase